MPAGTPLIDVRVKLEITVLEMAAPFASQTLNWTGMVGVVTLVNCVLPLVAIGQDLMTRPVGASSHRSIRHGFNSGIHKADGVIG